MFKQKKLSTWNEVDTALHKLGDLQRKVQAINLEYAPKLNHIKAAQAAQLDPLQTQIQELEEQIRTYCVANKAEFAEKRSKTLTHGSISARLTEKFDFPKTKEALKDLIQNLKNIGRDDCITLEETPDKAKIKQLDQDTHAKLGLKLEKTDNFTIKAT